MSSGDAHRPAAGFEFDEVVEDGPVAGVQRSGGDVRVDGLVDVGDTAALAGEAECFEDHVRSCSSSCCSIRSSRSVMAVSSAASAAESAA
jgi:hypothetical protein